MTLICLGLPTKDRNSVLGASSPANPARIMPDPLSTTMHFLERSIVCWRKRFTYSIYSDAKMINDFIFRFWNTTSSTLHQGWCTVTKTVLINFELEKTRKINCFKSYRNKSSTFKNGIRINIFKNYVDCHFAEFILSLIDQYFFLRLNLKWNLWLTSNPTNEFDSLDDDF